VKHDRWPASEGEMARLVREHNWAQTPLGPIEGWPQGLKALVDLVLASESVMCLMWGERAISLYNDAYATAIGTRHPGALGRSAFETWADVRPVFEPHFERAYGAGETAAERDLRFSFAGGVPSEEAWFDLTYSPVPDERGNVLGVLATLAETTDRVLAERGLADTKAMLEESERRYRAFVTASSDVVYRMGPDWAEMRQLDGRGFISDTAEPTERWMERYIHPDDRPLVEAAIGEAVRTKGVFELEHRVLRVDGTLGWTLSRAVPIVGARGEVLEWLGTASDVTARKEAEEGLRRSEENLRLITDSVPALIGYHDRGQRYRFVNAAYEEFFGVPREKILGRTAREFLGERVYGRLREGMQRALSGKRVSFEDMEPDKHGPGLHGWTEENYVPRFAEDGTTVEGFYTLAVDITERKWAEEALRESEERYRLAVEAADLGRWELTPETGEFYTSATCNRHLGVPEDAQPTHEEHFETIHPDDHAIIYERLRRAVEEGGEFEAEYRVIYPDGGVRRILSRARLLRSPDSAPDRLTGVTLDVTEARKLEEERERARARELTALTEAAERERISRELHDRVAHGLGVAHQSLELHSALAKTAPERAAEKLKLARETTRLALDQTRAISAELKRLQEEELEDGLEAAFRALSESSVSDGVRLDVSVSGEEATVPSVIALQVYLAMREAIRNAVRHSGCSRIGVALEVSDGEVRGLVEDDGAGFDPAAVGKATPSWGVGLGSMRDRAEMLGGNLCIDSAPGAGTRVEVRVPIDGRRDGAGGRP
jgi:PAS domain S-box-containing protein